MINSAAASEAPAVGSTPAPATPRSAMFLRLQKLMPDLLAEMRDDLARSPLTREFVIMSKDWVYNGEVMAYFFEDHPDLEGKVRILQNHGLIKDITYNNVARYSISEELAEYLESQTSSP